MSSNQLSSFPLCEKCNAYGILRAAREVDHLLGHRGDRALFFNGELRSLCTPCHAWKTAKEQAGEYYDYRRMRVLDKEGRTLRSIQ